MGKNCQTQKEPNKQAPAAALSEAVLLLWLRVRDSQSVLLSQDTDDETWRQHSRGPGSSAAASAGAAGAPHGETAPPARCAAAGGTHNLPAPRPALRRGLAGAPNCACPVGRRGGGQDQRAVGSLPAPRQAPATSEAAVSALGGVARSRGGRGVGGVEHPALAQREVTFLDRTRTAAPLQQLPAARPLGLAPSLAKLEDTSHSVAQGCGVATTP